MLKLRFDWYIMLVCRKVKSGNIYKVWGGLDTEKWKTAGQPAGLSLQEFHSNGVTNQKARELLSETWRHKPNEYQ